MHLRQPGYSACSQFAKEKEQIKQVKETGDLNESK